MSTKSADIYEFCDSQDPMSQRSDRRPTRPDQHFHRQYVRHSLTNSFGHLKSRRLVKHAVNINNGNNFKMKFEVKKWNNRKHVLYLGYKQFVDYYKTYLKIRYPFLPINQINQMSRHLCPKIKQKQQNVWIKKLANDHNSRSMRRTSLEPYITVVSTVKPFMSSSVKPIVQKSNQMSAKKASIKSLESPISCQISDNSFSSPEPPIQTTKQIVLSQKTPEKSVVYLKPRQPSPELLVSPIKSMLSPISPLISPIVSLSPLKIKKCLKGIKVSVVSINPKVKFRQLIEETNNDALCDLFDEDMSHLDASTKH